MNQQNLTGANGKPTFHIAFCVDDNYCRAMGATIASIIDCNPEQHFTFHVLTMGISDDNARRLRRFEEMYPVATALHVIEPARLAQFSHYLGHSHYSLSIFTRLLIPAVLQDRAARVLYLDADILCVGKVDEMVDMDISAEIAIVVPDVALTARRRVAALGLARAEYFNSGVMLINTAQWLAHDITEQTLATLLKGNKDMRFPDQDALNIVLNGRARYISPRWNYLYDLIHDLERRQSAMRPVGKAVFIHFAGSVKPWAGWSGHAVRADFRRSLDLSPWADMGLDSAPKNTKEMRMHSRFLYRQGKPLQSLRWFLRYLRKRAAR